jgi:cytochrome P450
MSGSELPIFPFDTPPEMDAEPEYAQLRREDPVPKVGLVPGGEAYLVSRYEDVKRVFTDPVFSRGGDQRPGGGGAAPDAPQPVHDDQP